MDLAPRQGFRDAMARLGAAVTVLTTDGPAGGRAGITASAVCSVTDDPPTLLACLNRGGASTPAFLANGVFCVNVLSARHRALSDAFAGVPRRLGVPERFAAGGAAWGALATGAPALADAVACFDCEVEEAVEKGTHTVLFGRVRAVRLGADEPALIWWARRYRVVGDAGPSPAAPVAEPVPA